MPPGARPAGRSRHGSRRRRGRRRSPSFRGAHSANPESRATTSGFSDARLRIIVRAFVAPLFVPLAEVDRAVVESEENGFAKILTAKGSDKILGATIVGARAGDLLHEFVLAMKAGIGLGTIASTIHAYPTFAELARKAGDKYNKTRLTPTAKKIFNWLYERARK